MEIEYRHPEKAEAGAIAKVINLNNMELKHHADITADDIRTWFFGDKDYDPKGFLLGFAAGQPVAYGGSMISKSRLDNGFKDAHVGLSVTPELRGKGVEEHLMSFSMGFLREKGMEFARLWAPEKNSWLNGFATKLGMNDIRHGYMMIYDKKEKPNREKLPKGYSFRRKMLKRTTDEYLTAFTKAFNESFFDHWNFSPMPEDRVFKIRDEEIKIGDSITKFTFTMKDGEIAGVCMYNIDLRYNEQNKKKVGWTQVLGVKKPHRRLGLGRALLADSMAWLWEQGMDTLYLGMDAENSKALELYTSQGYVVDEESVTYELKL